MQIINESGKKFKIKGIIEVDEQNTPVRILLRWGEFRKIYKSRKGYWFKYHNARNYLEELQWIKASYICEDTLIHIDQCLKCARLELEMNQCLSPDGARYFRGATQQSCRYFEERNDEEPTDD